MAARRKRDLLSTRRRAQDNAEDDEAAEDMADDSQSEGSMLTLDDEPDADDSDSNAADQTSLKLPTSGVPDDPNAPASTTRVSTKAKPQRRLPENGSAETPSNGTASVFKSTTDVDAMMNGLQISGDATTDEALDFETTTSDALPQSTTVAPSGTTGEGPTNATRGQAPAQADYKAKREADPAFVPTRGGFFMHDQRSDGLNHAGLPSSRGRGRGRGAVFAGGNSQARSGASTSMPTMGKWDHDLHEYITEPPPPDSLAGPTSNAQQRKQNNAVDPKPARQVGMSRSTAIGTVAVRIFLSTMKEPIVTSKKLTVKQHTKLPDLRSPLRRDKAVRVSLPDQESRYVFPSPERSFIFIPRAQRPNQQRNRSRNRSLFPQGGSRRTSVFGGSSYTPSVAMSRRSSQAQDGLLSPTGSIFSRPPPGAPLGPSRPIVKLPMAPPSQRPKSPSSSAIASSQGTPFTNLPQGSAYPLPSQPAYREHRSSQMTMHQPRPQKQVSVATIESPDRGEAFQVPQQQDQQPFHHQVPLQYSQGGPAGEQPYYPQMGQMYANGNNPLSNIPEGAINAQPFQPGMAPPQGYYPYAVQQPMYYYAPGGVPQADGQGNQYGPGQVTSPMFAPPTPYYVPMMLPMQPGSEDAAGNPQAGMYAHESNGMVYYFDPTRLADGNGQPGFPDSGGGGMMASGAEGYFGPPPSSDVVYYQQQ